MCLNMLGRKKLFDTIKALIVDAMNVERVPKKLPRDVKSCSHACTIELVRYQIWWTDSQMWEEKPPNNHKSIFRILQHNEFSSIFVAVILSYIFKIFYFGKDGQI